MCGAVDQARQQEAARHMQSFHFHPSRLGREQQMRQGMEEREREREIPPRGTMPTVRSVRPSRQQHETHQTDGLNILVCPTSTVHRARLPKHHSTPCQSEMDEMDEIRHLG